MECTSSLVKLAGTEVYECFLTKASLIIREKTVGMGKGKKKRLQGHVLAHHTGLDTTSFEGTPSNPGVVEKREREKREDA